MDNYKKGLIEIHISIFLVGLTGLFAKLINQSPIIIVFGRVFFAVVALAIVLWIMKVKINIQKKKDYLIFFGLGLLLAVHWGTFFHSIQISTVAVGLLTFSTFPLFVTFLEPIFFKDKIKTVEIVTAIIVFAGLIFVIPSWEFGNNIFMGAIWGVISGLTYAFISIINRKLVKRYNFLVLVFYQDLFAGLFLLPLLFTFSFAVSGNDYLLLILLGVVCTAFAHSLFVKGLQFVKAQTASVITSLEPVYAIIFALLLLNEIPEPRTLIGGVLILSGIIVSAKYHTREH